MPHELNDRSGNVNSYMHVGQHGGADYKGVVQSTKLATESEYSDLKAELESIGYDLKIVKKQNTTIYLNQYRNR